MDTLPLHPKIVHLPMALAVLMPFITVAILIAWRRGFLPRRVWLFAVAFQALLVGSALVAMNTGEAEGEIVEGIVAERFIEAHEEAAETFLWTAVGVLALAALAAAVPPERAATRLALFSILGSLGVLWMGYEVGQAGGELVYRHGAASAYVQSTESAQPALTERGKRLGMDEDDYDDD